MKPPWRLWDFFFKHWKDSTVKCGRTWQLVSWNHLSSWIFFAPFLWSERRSQDFKWHMCIFWKKAYQFTCYSYEHLDESISFSLKSAKVRGSTRGCCLRSWSSELLNGTKLKCRVSLGSLRNGQVKQGFFNKSSVSKRAWETEKNPRKIPWIFFLRLAKTEALYLFQDIRAGIPVSPSGGDWRREKTWMRSGMETFLKHHPTW